MSTVAYAPKSRSRDAYLANRLPAIKRSVAARLGELLELTREKSDFYLLTVRCARQHVFRLSTKNLARGIWCRECADIVRQEERAAMLAQLQAHATAKLGRCLADLYRNAKTTVEWECADGHRWAASWDNVRNKESWCPICARRNGP